MLNIVYTSFLIMFQVASSFIQFIYIGKIFFQKELDKKSKIISLIVLITLAITCLFIKNLYPLNLILTGLVFIFSGKFLLKLSFLKSIYFALISLVLSSIVEIFCVYIFMVILNKDTLYFLESKKLNMLINLLHTLLSFGILYLINRQKEKKNFTPSLNNKQIWIFMILLTFCILPQILIFYINRYNYSVYYLILNLVQMVVIYYFIFIYVKKYGERETLKKELELSEVHNKTMLKVIDGVRILKHDYNNIMQALNGYVVTKQYDKLKEHLDTILKECGDLNNVSTITPELFNNPAIYGIVGTKYFLATEQGINFEFDVTCDISNIKFNFSELSRIIGILLDNAIEATTKLENKYIRLEFKCDNRRNADIIKVINTFDSSKKINLYDIYKKGVSSKEVKSGLGLYKVSQLIKRTKNAQIFPSTENDLFIQTIVIEF